MGKITAGSQKSGMLHSLFAAAAFGRRRLKMVSACALAINKGRFVYTSRLLRPAELVGAKPLHLLAQTTLPLKSPTGAFIAAQTRAAPNAFSPEGPKPADAVKSLLLLAFTAPCVKKQNWNDRSRSNSAKIKINFPLNMARACGGHFKSSNCTLNRRYPRHAAH